MRLEAKGCVCGVKFLMICAFADYRSVVRCPSRAVVFSPSKLPFQRGMKTHMRALIFLAGCPPDKPFVASNEERTHV